MFVQSRMLSRRKHSLHLGNVCVLSAFKPTSSSVSPASESHNKVTGEGFTLPLTGDILNWLDHLQNAGWGGIRLQSMKDGLGVSYIFLSI